MSIGRNGLAKLAIHILSVIANSADAERAFSLFGINHTKLRNRLSTETVHKATLVRMDLRRAHVAAGLTRDRLKRKLTIHNEPSDTSISVSAGADMLSLDSDDSDDSRLSLDFETLGNALVRAAIDSRGHLEQDDDDGADNGPGTNATSISEAVPQLVPPLTRTTSAPTPLAPGTPPTRRTRKPQKKKYPLSTLFLYPLPPNIDPTSPEANTFIKPDDSVCMQRLQFIWQGGIQSLEREQQTTEMLQSSL